MGHQLESLLRSWEGHAIISRHDHDTGSWIFICLHDPTLGPCSGGTRMKTYRAPGDGLLDAQRLAEGMTQKWAIAGMPYGGGKAVIALGRELEPEARQGLLHRYGELVESLDGVFQTGEDLGTSTADLLEVAARTRFVHGFDADGQKLDPAPFTARGVYAGLRAALEHVYGDPAPRGRSVLVQGVGNVGRRLAVELAAAEAEVLVSDLDAGHAAEVAKELGGNAMAIPVDEVLTTPCDVYAPCAIGGTINHETVPRLACRIVAGSANNQLAERSDAEGLRRRGIVYAPDFIINGGGAIAFALLRLEDVRPSALLQRVECIGATIGEVLAEAAAAGESTLAAAEKRVARTLAEGVDRPAELTTPRR